MPWRDVHRDYRRGDPLARDAGDVDGLQETAGLMRRIKQMVRRIRYECNDRAGRSVKDENVQAFATHSETPARFLTLRISAPIEA
jgi:hypothetical protein